ncbi:hypothetical protein AVEN_214765-1 [Araneus ventricosus]|uniref:Uncharacterized protein n=1 Tax=Araneus ventricosus TaxID=182803 RepID=A0A4Y2SPQ6_ARAVE|nr:hypothetical protein AVEN_214765-1 [Araneus ventricosus]
MSLHDKLASSSFHGDFEAFVNLLQACTLIMTNLWQACTLVMTYLWQACCKLKLLSGIAPDAVSVVQLLPLSFLTLCAQMVGSSKELSRLDAKGLSCITVSLKSRFNTI